MTMPILFGLAAIILALLANRDVRRGASRYYTLEREILLRRARKLLLGALGLFALSLGWLGYNYQRAISQEETANATATAFVTITINAPNALATPVIEQFPPTLPPPPTEDPNRPTPTPTVPIRRAIIENTGGSGVYLREGAGTTFKDLLRLNDGDIVTLLNTEPIEADGYRWINIRTTSGIEGWTVELFLTIQER